MQSRAPHKRETHLGYVGTILPIRHPWWNTHLPPSDWNCKCWVKQTDKEPTDVPNEELTPPSFANNPGETAEFVNIKETPYYKHTEKELHEAVEEVAKKAQALLKKIEENRAKYEALDDTWEKVFFDEKSGGYLAIDKKRITSAKSKNDRAILAKEKETSNVYALNGNRIELWYEPPRVKSPDGLINSIPMDLKKTSSHNNIIKEVKDAVREKKAEIILFEFEKMTPKIQQELNKLKKMKIKYKYFITGEMKIYSS